MLTDRQGNQVYSEAFLLWCRKTECLTDEQWRKGFDDVEKLIDAARTEGKDPWPPSYHEFVTMAKGVSPGTGNAVAYMTFDDPRRPENDPSHPNYIPKQDCLPDLSARETNQKTGRAALSDLKGMFS